MTTSIKQLLSHYRTDKDTYHTYGDPYEKWFTPIQPLATSILEIGVAGGESLRAWRDFFPNAEIHGIDNNLNANINELRIQTHIGEQADPVFLVNVGFKYGPFDIIIDDGSHVLSDQVTSLLYLWQFLKPNGIYCIEDIQTEQNLDSFRHYPFVHIYDHRDRPSSPYDDLLVILDRHNVNYGFKCPTEGCLAKAHFSFLTPMNARPKCPRHQTHYVPDIDWPSNVKVEDVVVDPKWAKELLSNAFPSSFEGVDENLVTHYATLMADGNWRGVTIEMGGEHYPIYLRDDKVLLGIQRLQACIKANTSFQTVMVRTYGYY